MKKHFSILLSAFLLFSFSSCKFFLPKLFVTPNAVSDLRAVSEEGKIVITWVDPDDEDLLGIKIYNGVLTANRTVSFADGILVGKGLERYEISNLEDGKSYTFRVTAVNVDLLESYMSITEEVTFHEKVVEKVVEKEVEKETVKYICPVDLKVFETAEEAAECCGVQTEYVDKIVEVEKPVYTYICPKCKTEFETAEEAAECCGVQIEYVEVEVEKIVTKYVCPVDGEEYDSLDEAMACCNDKIVMDISSVKEGTYSVYHMLQNLAGGTAIVDYYLNEADTDKVIEEESSIEVFSNEYTGFEAVSMALQGSSIYVFYNRKTINYCFDAGADGEFDGGLSTETVSGLYGAEFQIPSVYSDRFLLLKWEDSEHNEVQNVFGAEDLTYNAVWWDDGLVKIKSEENGDFYISPTETTYVQWYEVYQWALENGYKFIYSGTEGNLGKAGAEPTEELNMPVCAVSWRDAVVWCNAASEKAGLTPVYEYEGKVIKEAQSSAVATGNGYAEQAVVNTSANGYRLPTIAEWQFAAAGGENYLYSGSDNPDDVAWTKNNATGVHDVQQLAANAYGIYDMSGNAWEWCQDVESEESLNRMMCGGSYYGASIQSSITSAQSRDAFKAATSFGFRVVRSSVSK